MTKLSNQSDASQKQGRVVALVIAGAMLFWLAAQVVGPLLGLPGRFALLIDLAVLAAFIWSLVVIYQIWRAQRRDEG